MVRNDPSADVGLAEDHLPPVWDFITVEGRYPLLSRLWPTQVRGEKSVIDVGSEQNYMQIFRNPVALDHRKTGSELASKVNQTLYKHLDAIEASLWNGIPEQEFDSVGYPRQTLGGAVHFLGREPVETDTLVLHVLRPPAFLRMRGAEDVFNDHTETVEFLTELTLEASPGDDQGPPIPRPVIPDDEEER